MESYTNLRFSRDRDITENIRIKEQKMNDLLVVYVELLNILIKIRVTTLFIFVEQKQTLCF